MSAPTTVLPLGCAVDGCGQTRRNHTADDHRWTDPDMDTVLDRAAALRQQATACVTCDLPERRWNPFDPLYIPGGSQCPDCTREDLNDEATRKHAEVAS